MEQMSLLDVVGEGVLGKQEKKAQKKLKNEESSSSSAAQKQEKKNEIRLPLNIYGGPYTLHIEGEGETTLKKLNNRVKKEFPELDGNFNIKKSENMYILEIKLKENPNDFNKLVAGVKYGSVIHMPVSGMDGKEAIQEFLLKYPEYMGASFYISKNNVIVPFFKEKPQVLRTYPTPIKIGYSQATCEELFFDKKEVSEKEILTEYTKQHPEYKNGSFLYFEKFEFLMPVMYRTEVKNTSKIRLPIKIKTGAYDIDFTAEDFGKNEITLETLRKGLEKEFPEYSKERTAMEYDPAHFVVAILISSKKGAKIHAVKKGYEISQKNGQIIENHPYGCFVVDESSKEINFLMKQKIPYLFLGNIIELFQKDTEHEQAVQIFLSDNQKFELFVPEQKATKNSVEFIRDYEKERTDCLVMDIHSHGTMPAFFSKIDNLDETGTRLFMVLGNLDCQEISIQLRAGRNGIFSLLNLEDVFV